MQSKLLTLEQYDTSLQELHAIFPGFGHALYFSVSTLAQGKTSGGGYLGFEPSRTDSRNTSRRAEGANVEVSRPLSLVSS